LTACCVISTESTNEKRSMRAPTTRLMSRHGRPYAENPGLVGSCGDDSALAEPSDYDGLAA
jgi:hypothetical protein